MSLMQAQALKGRMKYTGRPVDECDRHELRTWVIHLHIVGPSQDTWKGVQGRTMLIKERAHTLRVTGSSAIPEKLKQLHWVCADSGALPPGTFWAFCPLTSEGSRRKLCVFG